MAITVEEFKQRFGVAASDAADGDATKWRALEPPLADLFRRAMATGPTTRTKLEAAWSMATEKAGAGDFAAALKIAERLEPALRSALEAGGTGGNQAAQQEIPADVVPFQKARVLWVDTRAKMQREIRKLEDAIIAVCADDEELAPIAAEARDLTKRLEVFDTRLEETLEKITVTAAGPDRETLKKQAKSEIADYVNAMNDDFFNDVDGDNGFVDVAVAASARQSLASIAKTLG